MRVRNTVSRGLPPCALGTLLAQVCMMSPANAQQSDGASDRGLEEVVVTGSYLRRESQAELASPTQVLSAQALERTGFSSIAGILDKQTANIGSVGGVQDLAGGGADNRVGRSANLRGLGPSATLVLLNGRRIASAEGIGGFNYVNLAALVPLIDVQRVETVLDGASALYGSDAIAGVINVITDGKFDGLAANAQYNYIEDAPGYLVQVKMGGGTERSHTVFSLSYEFLDNSPRAHPSPRTSARRAIRSIRSTPVRSVSSTRSTIRTSRRRSRRTSTSASPCSRWRAWNCRPIIGVSVSRTRWRRRARKWC